MSSTFPSLSGKFLIAMPGMGDNRFDRSVVFLCAHSQEGAMGFIINQELESPAIPDFLMQLEIINEDEVDGIPDELAKAALNVGGPVEPGRGFVLHSYEYESDATLDVTDTVRLTATLDILRLIATGKGPKNCLVALGYAGWSAGQLEDEISSNGWLTVDADDLIIFDQDHTKKYERSLKLLGVDAALLSSDAGHA
jgi:putative transcriptional regulator